MPFAVFYINTLSVQEDKCDMFSCPFLEELYISCESLPFIIKAKLCILKDLDPPV